MKSTDEKVIGSFLEETGKAELQELSALLIHWNGGFVRLLDRRHQDKRFYPANIACVPQLGTSWFANFNTGPTWAQLWSPTGQRICCPAPLLTAHQLCMVGLKGTGRPTRVCHLNSVLFYLAPRTSYFQTSSLFAEAECRCVIVIDYCNNLQL